MSDGSVQARLILCADDFAHSSGTSRVIADLLAARRLSATGCMTLRPGWADDARMLRDVPAEAEIGLHLVLTEEAPLTAMARFAPDGRLPAIARLHRGDAADWPIEEIAAEVDAQFHRFAAVMGRAPAFVDGHQHVLHLAGIRPIVLAATVRHAAGAWLRTCEDRPLAMLARPWRGKALASAYRARGFARDAAWHTLATNSGFAGHYGFAGDYAAIFPAFLRRPGQRHLVMCHPGVDTRRGDAIAAARPVEAAALATLPLAELAAAHGLCFAA
jgi:hypothetical protein